MEPGPYSIALRKLQSMLGYLDELEAELPSTVQGYLTAGRVLHGFVERKCQVVIEAAIDAAGEILSATGRPVPASARDIFDAVRRFTPLDQETVRRFTGTFVGFRNRLVHDYEEVDDRVVYHTARQLLIHGRAFVTAITAFVDAEGAGPTP